jgi:hypothetical protein
MLSEIRALKLRSPIARALSSSRNTNTIRFTIFLLRPNQISPFSATNPDPRGLRMRFLDSTVEKEIQKVIGAQKILRNIVPDGKKFL